MTPIHCWLLIGFGALAALATLHRRTTLAATVFGAIGGLLLFAIGTASLGTPAGGHSTLRLWRFEVGDSVLFSVLTAYNFALFLWLVANAVEGPDWVRRDTDKRNGEHGDRRRPSRPAEAEASRCARSRQSRTTGRVFGGPAPWKQ